MIESVDHAHPIPSSMAQLVGFDTPASPCKLPSSSAGPEGFGIEQSDRPRVCNSCKGMDDEAGVHQPAGGPPANENRSPDAEGHPGTLHRRAEETHLHGRSAAVL